MRGRIFGLLAPGLQQRSSSPHFDSGGAEELGLRSLLVFMIGYHGTFQNEDSLKPTWCYTHTLLDNFDQ
jgi:hypothetical protein